jgi:hypothetical protein
MKKDKRYNRALLQAQKEAKKRLLKELKKYENVFLRQKLSN